MTPKKNKELKEEIARVHERGSGDFQSLHRQVEKETRRLEYNYPQLIATHARQKVLHLEWGRGTGKTTIIGDRLRKLLYQMPRSSGVFIAPTYQYTLTRILPSLIQGLELQGLYQNLHYFVGKLPPRSWRNDWGTAYQPPEKFGNYITFYNGMGIHLISQDVPGDGRGLNTDWVIGDEAALLNINKIEENIDPTLRGTAAREFKNKFLFGSKLYTSSTPITAEGRWFIEMEEKALINPKKFCLIRADARHNQANLRPGYLEEARESAYNQWIFEAEYLNVRPKVVTDGFYPLLDTEVHAYTSYDYNHYTNLGKTVDCRGDSDLVPEKPLSLGVDWGATINCMVVGQRVGMEMRILKSMYVLGDNQETQQDLIRNFNKYYRHHPTKRIILWYDASGNNETGFTKRNRAEMARDQLTKLGWRVETRIHNKRTNPMHEKKYILWQMLLGESNPERPQQMPLIRINKPNCKELWISMSNAKVLKGTKGDIKKDKRGETKGANRMHKTDLSDACDYLIYGMFNDMMYGGGGSSIIIPESRVSSQ